MAEERTFWPNSTQYPNLLTDQLMYLLTSDEWKVVSYVCRRTFGFQKWKDPISYDQLMHGLRSRATGKMLDGGTGLTEYALKKALRGLCKRGANLLLREKREGQESIFSLNLDINTVRVDWLLERRRRKEEQDRQRTSKARQARGEDNPGCPTTGVVPQPDTPVVPQPDTPVVPQPTQNKGNKGNNGDIDSIWTCFLTEVERQMTKATFHSWVAPCSLIAITEDNGTGVNIRIRCKTVYAQEWLTNRLRPIFLRTFEGLLGKPVTTISFETEKA